MTSRRSITAVMLAAALLGVPSRAADGPNDVVTLPAARGGQDRVDRRFAETAFTRWIGPTADDDAARPHDPATPKPGATLYRWWTDGCPYCRASLPAMETLRRTYADAGLRVVGVYHPKPPRSVDDDDVRAAAAARGFAGPIAVDEDWSVLREAYLRWGQRRATSIALLVDERGVIRFVHPGPSLFPSSRPEDAQANADFALLEQAIRVLLRSATTTAPPQPERRP